MGSPLVPLNDALSLDAFIEAGAEEFYLGFHDPQWEVAFDASAEVNRLSGFGSRANQYDFAQALYVAQMVKQAGKSIYLTFNASSYGAQTYNYITWYFSQLAMIGLDGVILSGPEFCDAALECGLIPVASTMCAIYNRDIARFYRSCGFGRMILPRDLSVAEIASIVESVPDAEYEVFMMRNGCIYSDAYCLGTHGGQCGALCGELRRSERTIRTNLGRERAVENSSLHTHTFHRHACGLCALWDFEQMGINAYKIVGRCDESDAITADTRMVARNVEIARDCTSRGEYFERMERHVYADQICDRKLNCYYPDVISD